jgi:hypothetical protein
VIAHARDLAADHAQVLAPLRHLDAEELLAGEGVADVVDDRRHVVQPVGVRERLVVEAALALLLEAAVEIADLHLGVLHGLAVELQVDPDRAVRRRMRRAHLELERLEG